MNQGRHLLTVSAAGFEDLTARARSLGADLAADPGQPLAEVARALAATDDSGPYRLATVAANPAQAAELLRAPGSRGVVTGRVDEPAPSVVYLFPGVGDHYVGMAGELYRTLPVVRTELDRCAELLCGLLGYDLREVLCLDEPGTGRPGPAPPAGPDLGRLLAAGPAGGRLDRTSVAQPVVFAVEYALARLLESLGVRPAALAGHSLGEYAAACVAGVFPLEAALTLVARRSELIEGSADGATAVVLLGPERLAARLGPGLWLAAADSPQLSVVSGTVPAVTELIRRLHENGVASRRLPTRNAFHSGLLAGLEEPLRAEVRAARPTAPTLPMTSNVTGTWLTDEQAVDPGHWARHLTGTVRFAEQVAELWRLPRPVFVEVGPGGALGTLVRQHPGRASGDAVVSVLPVGGGVSDTGAETEALLTALGRLWVAGVPLDRPAVTAGTVRAR